MQGISERTLCGAERRSSPSQMVPFLERGFNLERRRVLPFWSCPSCESSTLTLLSRPAGTDPALLPPDTILSRSLLETMTLGLGCPPALSVALPSLSSNVSVSFRFVMRSRWDLPTDADREADSDSWAFLSAARICILSFKTSPSSCICSPSLMFSRSLLSSSLSRGSDLPPRPCFSVQPLSIKNFNE